jgi:hypothetical protein
VMQLPLPLLMSRTRSQAQEYLSLCRVSFRSLKHSANYRVIQEERSIFWEVIISLICENRCCDHATGCEWVPR